MNRNIVIGVGISVLVHVSVLYGDRLLPERKIVKTVVAEAPKIQLMQMPKIDEPEPEVLDTHEESKPLDLAPPMQQDTPQLATPDSFVQKIQPPPPDNIKISNAMNIVPEVRDTNMFNGMKVFDVSMLDQTPVARFQAQPQYPFEMRRANLSGEVLVDFIVDTNGDVQNASVVHSTKREFEAAAVAAVLKWKFKPGRKGGKDVPTHMQVPIAFTLSAD
jgi:protein TonB